MRIPTPLALLPLLAGAVACTRDAGRAPHPPAASAVPSAASAVPVAPPLASAARVASPAASGSAAGASARAAVCKRGASLAPWRYSPTLTRLADGRVLVAGGRQHDGGGYMKDAQIYDPSRDAFTPVAAMAEGRAMHAAARLADGRVVVGGGMATAVELFDPAARAWTRLGKMARPVAGAVAVALPDGRAVLAGGDLMWKGALSSDVYVVDPAARTVTPSMPLPEARADAFGFPIAGGGVRLVGGSGFAAGDAPAKVLSAPAGLGAWTVGPADDPTALALAHPSRPSQDFVLLRPAGDEGPALGLAPRAILAYGAAGWTPSASLALPRTGAAATVLDDGRVLVAGGLDASAAPVEVCDVAAGGDLAAEVAKVVGLTSPEVRRWNAIPGGAVALQGEGPGRARLAVAQRAGAWKKVAIAAVDLVREGCEAAEAAPGAPNPALDLAPYRLDAGTVAIGVRYTCGRTFPAGESSETWLHLFRVQGETLERVLDVVVASADHQRGPGEDVTVTGIVQVEPRAGGLAELVVRRTTTRTPLAGSSGKKASSAAVERYTWSGSRYELRAPAK